MATIWEVSDELWALPAPVIAAVDPPKPTGRRRVDARAILNAILFRLRSGYQWNQLPERFADDSTVHRTFQRWVRPGLFERVWVVLVERCAELGGVKWAWPAADGAMGKARLGGLIGRNPTGRGKRGVKRSLLVEADGGPLTIVIAGANVHDTKLLAATLAAVVVEQPQPTPERPQHLCLDLGYDNPTGAQAVASHHYIPHLVASARRSSIWLRARSAFPRAAGWWNARWRGCPSAARCSSATTNTPRIFGDCSSSPAPCSGSVASIACPF